MKFLLCFGIMLAFVTERALSQQYLLGKLPIQSDGRNFGGIFDPVLTRVSSLETSVAPLTSGFPTLQNQIATLQSQVSPLQSLQSQVTNLQSQVSPLQNSTNQIATLQSQLSSLQNSTNQIATLQSQLSSLQTLTNQLNTSLAATNTKLAADEITIAAAQANITSLNAQLIAATAAAAAANTTANLAQTAATAAAAAAPKCPTAAAADPIGAKMVNGVCLSIGGSDATLSTLVDFATAQTKCANNGGILAEPSAIDVNFWTNLNSVFSAQVTALATNGMYVALTSSTTSPFPYTYLSGTPIGNGAPVWLGTPITPVTGAAAYVKATAATSRTWLNPGTTGPTTPRGYICQY